MLYLPNTVVDFLGIEGKVDCKSWAIFIEVLVKLIFSQLGN